MRRYLIAAGTARYRDAEELLSVPKDLAEIGAAFAEVGYERALELVDPGTDGIRRALGSWARDEDRADDALVVYYTGHGERDGSGHFLLCADSETGGLLDTALRTEDIAAILTSQGVRRLLVIVDTCYAEDGTARAVRRMAELLRADLIRERDGEYRDPLAFAVIAAARVREPADDGAFAHAFRAALRHPEIGGQRQPYLYLEAVVDSVNQQFERDGLLQHATCAILSHESKFGFLPNPRFADELPPEGTDLAEQRVWLTVQARRRRDELAQHFSPRGRGTDIGAEAGHYFVGRVDVLRRLSSWLAGTDCDHRAIVVTGSPGAGKSAVLGRLVVLSDPASCETIPPATIPLGTEPGIGSIDVAIHARHKTMAELVAGIAAGAGLDTDVVDELVTALSERAEPLVVVVDALDEAGTADDREPERIARELLRCLARIPCVQLLVGTRRHVIEACGPDFAVFDLDSPQWINHEDLASYAELLLLAPHGPGSDSAYDATTAPPIAQGIAETAYPNYLVARLTARTLAARDAVVSALPGWQRALPAPEPEEAHAAGPAFRWALAEQLGAEEQRARELLIPLAFAEGAGLPWGIVWPAVASSIAGRPIDSSDIEWLLTASSSHVVEALDERNRSVYRLYHESFTDQLRADAPPDAQQRIADALLGLVSPHPDRDSLDWSSADPYIHTHLATHAAACNRLNELALDPEFLLAAEPEPLLRAMTSVTDDEAVLARTAYEQCVHLLEAQLPLGERASILHLSAQVVGARALTAELSQLPGLPWHTRWSQQPGTKPHQRSIGLHEHEVTAVAYVCLADTPSLVTGDASGTVHIWKLSSGERTHHLADVHNEAIRALSVLSTPDGELVVILDERGNLSGWYPLAGKLIGDPIFSIRGFRVDHLAATMLDGDPVAAVSSVSQVWVWNLRTATRLTHQRVAYSKWRLQALSFVTWHGQPAVVGAVSRLPRLFGTQAWRRNPFRVVMFTVDGKRIEAWRAKDVQALGVWDLNGDPTIVTIHKRGKPTPARLAQQLAEIRLPGSTRFSYQAKAALIRHVDRPLIAVSDQGYLTLWDVGERREFGAVRVTASQRGGSAKPVGFETDGTTWLAVPAGRSVLAIDIDQQSSLSPQPAHAVSGLALWTMNNMQNRACVVTSVGSPSSASSVIFYDLETGELLDSGHDRTMVKTVFGGGLAQDATLPLVVTMKYGIFGREELITAGIDGSVLNWHYKLPPRKFSSACHLIGEGELRTVVLVCRERVVHRRLPEGDPHEFKISYCLSSAGLVVDGKTMLFVLSFDDLTAFDLDTAAKLWSRNVGLCKLHLLGPNATGTGWAGDTPIVVVNTGLDLVPHNARTGEPVGPALAGHALPPSVIEMGTLHDRHVLVSGGADRTVRVWDIGSARQVALIDVGSIVTALKFVPGDALVVGTEIGVMRIDLSAGLFGQVWAARSA